MPFFNDLTGSSENIVEGTDLTAKGITSSKDVSTTIRRGVMFSATDLSRELADGDPLTAIGNLMAGFWMRDHQAELLNILKGVFACADMSDHILGRNDKKRQKCQYFRRSIYRRTSAHGRCAGADYRRLHALLHQILFKTAKFDFYGTRQQLR